MTQLVNEIGKKIYVVRGQQVMLDRDLADFYEASTKSLNQQVKRNPERFPNDFMFQMTESESKILRSQFVTSRFYSWR